MATDAPSRGSTDLGSSSFIESVELGPQEALDQILHETSAGGRSVVERLPTGRTLEARSVSETEDLITVRGPSGAVELEVRMTAVGPVLRFRSADLQLESTGQVQVECETFHVHARQEIVEETDGDHHVRVAGDATRSVRGDLEDEGRVVNLRSRRGDVRIKANDDVLLNGERVKLNCPLP